MPLHFIISVVMSLIYSYAYSLNSILQPPSPCTTLHLQFHLAPVLYFQPQAPALSVIASNVNPILHTIPLPFFTSFPCSFRPVLPAPSPYTIHHFQFDLAHVLSAFSPCIECHCPLTLTSILHNFPLP